MKKDYSFSEWVRICIDECGCGYDYEQTDSTLKLTIDRSVSGLKAIGTLLQLIENKQGDLEEQIQVGRNFMVSLGFLIDELAENIDLCLESRENILKRLRDRECKEENAACEEGGDR